MTVFVYLIVYWKHTRQSDKLLAHKPPEFNKIFIWKPYIQEGDTPFKVAKAVEYIFWCRYSKLNVTIIIPGKYSNLFSL